jgi:hypothetical protein
MAIALGAVLDGDHGAPPPVRDRRARNITTEAATITIDTPSAPRSLAWRIDERQPASRPAAVSTGSGAGPNARRQRRQRAAGCRRRTRAGVTVGEVVEEALGLVGMSPMPSPAAS